jgi:hypothetical protein
VIICLFKRQAEIISKLKSFEADMAFKRVQDSEINEVVFAAFLPEINKGQ